MIYYQFSLFSIHLTLGQEAGGTFEFTPNKVRSIALIHVALQNLASARVQFHHKKYLVLVLSLAILMWMKSFPIPIFA